MRNEGAARWAAIGIGAGACRMLPQGTMLASSRNLAAVEGPKRRAKTPALQSRRERATTDKSQPSARSIGGPMQASAPTQGATTPWVPHNSAGIGPYAGGGLPLPAPLPVYVIL